MDILLHASPLAIAIENADKSSGKTKPHKDGVHRRRAFVTMLWTDIVLSPESLAIKHHKIIEVTAPMHPSLPERHNCLQVTVWRHKSESAGSD